MTDQILGETHRDSKKIDELKKFGLGFEMHRVLHFDKSYLKAFKLYPVFDLRLLLKLYQLHIKFFFVIFFFSCGAFKSTRKILSTLIENQFSVMNKKMCKLLTESIFEN